jgi:four helix bundle protein
MDRLVHSSVRMTTDSGQDIRDRSFRFACAVARVALALPPRPGVRCVADQLLKAATAVGANLEEAKAGSSRREFTRMVEISLREAREAVYWLRICREIGLGPRGEVETLQAEGDQIARILGTIVVRTKARTVAGAVLFALCILNFSLRAS